jgi:hypothetical protein
LSTETLLFTFLFNCFGFCDGSSSSKEVLSLEQG